MIKFAKHYKPRNQTDFWKSYFGKVLGGAIMKFKLKDPGSAITHGIAFLLAAVGAATPFLRHLVPPILGKSKPMSFSFT